MEEVELASSACCFLSLATLIPKPPEKAAGKRKLWLFLRLSGNETVTMWVKGIHSGAKDSTLATGKLAHKSSGVWEGLILILELPLWDSFLYI